MKTKNKLVVISGCSGGGKSTLLYELKTLGYSVVPEVGREIVKEQLEINGHITPWENPRDFCELLIEKSLLAYHRAKSLSETKNRIIFFDRSFLEGVSYFQTLKVHHYDYLVTEYRYDLTIFMAPPWEEIFCHDDERKHSFSDSVLEYERLIKFYAESGYKIIQIPKESVLERADFIIKNCESSEIYLRNTSL